MKRREPEIDLSQLDIDNNTKDAALESTQAISRQAIKQTGAERNSVTLMQTQDIKLVLKTTRPRKTPTPTTADKIRSLEMENVAMRTLLENRESKGLRTIIIDAVIEANKQLPLSELSDEQQRYFVSALVDVNRKFAERLVSDIKKMLVEAARSSPNQIWWYYEVIGLLTKALSLLEQGKNDFELLSEEQRAQLQNLSSRISVLASSLMES